jgi:hypothetical protein
MLASLCQYCFREIFFPNVPLADELDPDASLRRHLFGIFTNPVAERFGELRVVEDPDIPLVQKRVIPPAKQTPGNVPNTNIRSKQPNTPAICEACRSVNSSMPIPAS